MPKIIVEVMPKEVLLDPQGKAVANSLHRTGHKDITAVRIGKRIELHFDRPVTEADVADAAALVAEVAAAVCDAEAALALEAAAVAEPAAAVCDVDAADCDAAAAVADVAAAA